MLIFVNSQARSWPFYFFSKFSDFAMLRKYPKRFLVTKLLGNGPFQMKIGANDSELTCATFFKKSCSGQKIKNNTIFNIYFFQVEFPSIFKSLFWVRFMSKSIIMLLSKKSCFQHVVWYILEYSRIFQNILEYSRIF